MKRIGVDVGGTHTDLVLVDEATGRIHVNKVPTIAGDPARATVQGLRELAQTAGVALESVDYFMHGTTIATNIVVQHDGALCGMITTEGFRDILHIARSKRPSNFSLQLDLPWQKHPLVERRHRLTVPERICGPHGEVLKPLDEDAVRRAARALRGRGVESIAVCFLFSYLNPDHERRAVEIVAEECPGTFVCASHEVMAQYREFERFATTALNAYVGPRTVGYVGKLEEALRENGLRCGLHLMQSNGGCATVAGVARRPVTLLMSGPVAGLIGGMWAGRLAGEPNVISLDVGGTSADIGVAVGVSCGSSMCSTPGSATTMPWCRWRTSDTIGAGGGSIAYVDPGGQFQVGPKRRRSGAGPGLLRTGRDGGDGHRLPTPARTRARARTSRRTCRSRPRTCACCASGEARPASRNDGGASGARRNQDRESQHDPGDRGQQRAQGVRPPRVRAGRLRRRGTAVRLRHRGRDRHPPAS